MYKHSMRADGPSCEFRFYEELNDFLSPELRKKSFSHRFSGTPSVKDTIEALGVPHTEIDLILVDGISVDFSYLLKGGERIAVYPAFERLDIAPVTRLRPTPLREPRSPRGGAHAVKSTDGRPGSWRPARQHRSRPRAPARASRGSPGRSSLPGCDWSGRRKCVR